MVLPTKKKVLYLITKSNWGGAQRYVYDLATHLDPHQFTVAVALGGNGILKQKLTTGAITVHQLDQLTNRLSPIKNLIALRAIYKLCRTTHPDVLHVNSSVAGLLGCVAGRMSGVPKIIFTAHGWAFNEDRSYIGKLFLKALHWLTVLLSHSTIVVSVATKTQMNWPLTANKMTVIHNGRTVEFLPAATAEDFIHSMVPALDHAHASLRTVTIGELHPTKQHEVVIKAIATARAAGQLIHHTIIGDGIEQTRLTELVNQLKLQDYIHFTGAIEEAAQYLKAFDVFILASSSEAFGLVVLEARLAGLPVIATRVGGIPEIITDGKNGVLVEQNDYHAIATTLEKLHSDHTYYQTLAAPQGEAEKFSFANMATRTTALYMN